MVENGGIGPINEPMSYLLIYGQKYKVMKNYRNRYARVAIILKTVHTQIYV